MLPTTQPKLIRNAPAWSCSFTAVNSGMRTLKMDGMEKMLMGLTDLEAGPVGASNSCSFLRRYLIN
jgi:hypothetical protein